MKNSIFQIVSAVVTAVSVNIIGWPGPHGGLQFLGEGLWSTDIHFFKVILLVAVVLGIIAALIPQQGIRYVGTLASVAILGTLFLLLLTRIYPPVIPIVLITAIPFLASLAASVVFAVRSIRKERAKIA